MTSFPHLPSPAVGLLIALMDSPSSAKEMILDQLSSSISSLRNGFLRRCSRWDGNNVAPEGPGQGRPATTIPTVRTSQEVVLKRRGEFQAEECPICWEMLRDSDASVSLVGFSLACFIARIRFHGMKITIIFIFPSLWEDFLSCFSNRPTSKSM